MEIVLRIGLSNAVAALLLALVVVIVACAWRRPAVLHALWILVLVKLVTPPLVWLPEPWTEAADPAPSAAAPPPAEPAPPDPPTDLATAIDAPPADPTPPDGPDAVLRPPAWEAVLVPVEESPAAAPAVPADAPAAAAVAPSPAPAAPWWATAALGAWLAGSLAWYGLAVLRLRRFRRLLRHAAPAPESLRQRTHRLAEKMGLRSRPAVWLVPGRVAPMLWAVGGPPRILFPAELLDKTTPEQQNALLAHELAHLRRRDHWVRWLEFAAAGLYWWNPVLWFARRELREAEEQCCDAWVTSTLPGAGKAYAVALLETLDFLSDAPPAAPLLASGVGRVADLKRRLTMIMRGTTPRALGWRGLLAVVGLGALMLPLLPAWARAQAPPKPAPEEPPAAAFFIRFAGAGADADPAPASPEDLEKAKAELKELEALLRQKQAEVADLQAKMEAVRAKLGKAGDAPKHRVVIEAGADARAADVKDLMKWIQSSPAGMAGQVIVIDKDTGKIIMEMKGPNPPAPPAPPVPPMPGFAPQFELRLNDGKQWVVVPKALPPAGVSVAPPGSDTDKRIDELEQRLKKILDEVEQLRKERKPGAPENSGAPLHSYGPAPIEKFLYLDKVFRNTPAEAEERAKAEAESLRAKLEELQKQAADERVRQEALTAEREKVAVFLKQAAAEGSAQLDQAKAQQKVAAAAVKKAEAQAAAAEDKGKGNPAATSPADVKAAQADVEVRRAELAKAKAVLEQAAVQKQAQEEDTVASLKACEQELRACQERLKALEAKIKELNPGDDGDPKKKH